MKRNNKTNKDIIKNTKAKTVKRPIKKEIDTKAVIKDISARGKKMFLTNRKTVSALKKLTKNLAKLITEANQTGDQKLVGRITKLFGYLGFNTDSDANKVSWCFDAKVKPMKAPKVKPEKKPAEKVKRERKPRVKKDKAVEPEQVPAQPAVESETSATGAEPTPEELEKLDNERPPEVLAGDANDLANVEESGSVDEPDGDDDEQEPNEEDEDPECDGDDSEDADEQEPPSYEDGLAEFRREAWNNGDFVRDDA